MHVNKTQVAGRKAYKRRTLCVSCGGCNFLMQIRGSPNAFIHHIIENSPFASSFAVAPTTKSHPWDRVYPQPRSSPASQVLTEEHSTSLDQLSLHIPMKELGGLSPGFCWKNPTTWQQPAAPALPTKTIVFHRATEDAQMVLTGFLHPCKLPCYQPRQGCDCCKCSYVQERGCGLQDMRTGEKKVIKQLSTLQAHSSCRIHRAFGDSILS